jgi:hypothetical protein
VSWSTSVCAAAAFALVGIAGATPVASQPQGKPAADPSRHESEARARSDRRPGVGGAPAPTAPARTDKSNSQSPR